MPQSRSRLIRLQHFTSREHWPRIQQAGFLKTVESNLSRRRDNAGPDVVWLSTHEDASAGLGLVGSSVDKTEVRVTVEVPMREVHKWTEWAARRGIEPDWRDILASAGGSRSWRVIERRVTSSEWVEVRNMKTDEILWERSVQLPRLGPA